MRDLLSSSIALLTLLALLGAVRFGALAAPANFWEAVPTDHLQAEAAPSTAATSVPDSGSRTYLPLVGRTPHWLPAASMGSCRKGHSATLLTSGNVLIAGGWGGTGSNCSSARHQVLSSAELYDPVTNTWSFAASMNTARSCHSATLLSSGKVLVVGGSAELYDPATNTWSPAGEMVITASCPGAVRLRSGKVLVVTMGGYFYGGAAELYDPNTNTWSLAGTTRYNHDSVPVLMPDGKVLLAGGRVSLSCHGDVDLYDEVSNSWSTVAPMKEGRCAPAVLLPSGKVLVAGGRFSFADEFGILSSVELYDPVADSWSYATAMSVPHAEHTLTVLQSGKVLAGGWPDAAEVYGYTGGWPDATEIYDPANDTWTSGGSMTVPRGHHTATLLPSGSVLVGGGDNYNSYTLTETAELYIP